MPAAPLPPDEQRRLAALHSFDVLDTAEEEALDDLASLAATLTGSPMALVSLVDADRQWFKARVGLDVRETPRDLAFCAHAILSPGRPLSVPDARADPRFLDNPLVTGEPGLRAYLGVPLVTREGHALGTLCVLDRRPRQHDAATVETVRRLARAVTTQLELRRALRREARAGCVDALTGVLSRRALSAELETMLARGESLAAIVLDLDHFKETNDAHGHPAGDAVLVEAARRLRAALRPGDVVGRLGGDEFVVLLPGIGDAAAARRVAAGLARTLAGAVPYRGQSLRLGATLGVAVSPGDARDAPTLLRLADEALIRAKRDRRGSVGRARPEDAERVSREATLVLALREAQEGALPGLGVHLQPLVALASGEVAALEALARWTHPEHGPVPPAEMFALAERLGSGDGLSSQARGLALGIFARLRRDGLAPARLNLNLSAAELLRPDVVEGLERQVEAAGLDLGSVTLEITEDAVLDRVAGTTLERLASLRGRGARIALDDFGTGTSGLAQLLRIPLDAIKLDRTFTRRLGTDAKAARVTEGAIRLGHSMGFEVTAEGIEEEGQARLLLGLGCDLGQGWHFAKPMEEGALRPWLRARGGAEARVVPLRRRTGP